MNQYHNIPSLDCLWTQYWTVKFTQLYLVEGQLQILINVGCMENQTEIYSTTLCFLGEKTRVWNKRWGLEWDIISTCENGIFFIGDGSGTLDSFCILHMGSSFWIRSGTSFALRTFKTPVLGADKASLSAVKAGSTFFQVQKFCMHGVLKLVWLQTATHCLVKYYLCPVYPKD